MPHMLTVVIPAYNEEQGIADTVRRVQEVLAASAIEDAEVLVVDDGSIDGTAKRAADAGATVVSNPHNVGYGRSLKRGIQAARHDTVCIIDADLTYPAEAIPALLAEYRRGSDMVVGRRQDMDRHDSFIKSPMRRLLKFLVEFSAGRKVPDANSGLRIFSQRTILGYLPHLCDKFSFTTSMTIAYMLTGRFVTYVPIEYRRRVGSTHVRLWRDSFRTVIYVCQSTMYYSPLKIFILFAAACVLISMASAGVGALTGIKAGYFLGLGGLLVALLMFGLGLLADVLRQIMLK